MSTGEPTNEVLLFILEWVWVPVVTAMLALTKKVFGLHTKTERLDERMDHFEQMLNRVDEQNTAQHGSIEDKIDRHNDRVTKRLDSVVTLLRNGNGK